MARWSWALVLLVLLISSISVNSAPVEEAVADDGVIDASDIAGAAEGVETVYFFLRNRQRTVTAGKPAEILAGVSNNGASVIRVNSISASLHLPLDHKLLVQNITALEFVNVTIPVGVQATFAYPFTVSKFLQAGSFDLVATVSYELGGDFYKSVFYNGTVEIVDAGGFVGGETVFLGTLALGLLGLFGMWIYGQVQRLSKTRKPKFVEAGSRAADTASDNEWLKGTAFMQKPKSAKLRKK